MEKGYESILRFLENGEKIIYKTDKNFKFGENNNLILGEKFFCISNLGKIFITNKNKKIKGNRVYIYNHREKNIKFKVLTKDNIVAINSREFTDNRTESFIINMKIDDFVNLYNKIDDNPFIVEWSKYLTKFNNNIYESALIDLRDKELSINTISNKLNLNYDDILNFDINENVVNIITNKDSYHNIEITCFNKKIEDIYNKIRDSRQDSARKNKSIDFTQVMNYDDLEVEVDMVLNKDIDSDEETISNYYKKNLNLEGNKEVDLQVEFKDNKTEASNNVVIEGELASLFGLINHINYKGRNVNVILDEDFKLIDNDLNKEILNVKIDELEYIDNTNILICKFDDEIFLLELAKKIQYEDLFKRIIDTSTFIGYTFDKQPFVVNITSKCLNLMQGKNNNLISINSDDIADLNILDSKVNFENIAITLKNSDICKLYLDKNVIASFIENIYIMKSREKFQSLSAKNLKKIYLKAKSEELNLLLFSNINKIKVYIDDFYKTDNKDRKLIVSEIFACLNQTRNLYKLIYMYYIESINILDIHRITKYRKELKTLIKELEYELESLYEIIMNLDIFTKGRKLHYRNTLINSDLDNILEELSINTEYLNIKEIFIDEEIDDYNFDEILIELCGRVNNMLFCNMPYYKKYIDEIMMQIYKEDNCVGEIEYTDEIVKHYVRMQFKSATDNKIRRKDLVNTLNKYSSVKSKVEEFDILNLAKF